MHAVVLGLQSNLWIKHKSGNGRTFLQSMLYFTLLGGQVLEHHEDHSMTTLFGGCLVMKIHLRPHNNQSELSSWWSCCGPEISGLENDQMVWSCCGHARALVLLHRSFLTESNLCDVWMKKEVSFGSWMNKEIGLRLLWSLSWQTN